MTQPNPVDQTFMDLLEDHRDFVHDHAAPARTLSEATRCNDTRHAKGIFGAAVKQGLIIRNPFVGQPTQPKGMQDHDGYVSREAFANLLNACPNVGWKVLLGLQRIVDLARITGLGHDEADDDLKAVTEAWPKLPAAVRRQVVELVAEAASEKQNAPKSAPKENGEPSDSP